MNKTPTTTLTLTSTNLTVVALHTLNTAHASASINWNAYTETTELNYYVVGETDASGKFRLDRPIETWSGNYKTFFEPGATGSSADRLICHDQQYVTLEPNPSTTLGYAVQECAKVHIYHNNLGDHSTTTGSVTITPRPIKTIVGVTTTVKYKSSLSTKTKVIIGFSVTFGVIIIGLMLKWCTPQYDVYEVWVRR
ncbi:hypothetical protein DL96DRAFT_1759093 [Flagelloscypha sp. PMI_526]|nr:hypothetical protein DL96DRAFT_1759093 [Flagelloscypha sp. PMI_526]